MDGTKESVTKLLSSADPAERRFAAEDLAGAQGFAPVAALAAALRDDNKGVRDAATRSLEQIGNENVARAVVEYLADRNIITRNLAADLLMRLKDHSVSALLPYLYDADQDVRKFAVDILGGIGSEEAVTHLITSLEDNDLNVVVSAAEALGNVKSIRAVPDLIRLFNRIKDAQPVVAEALGKIGGIQAEDFLSHQIGEILSVKPIDNLLLYAVYESLSKIGTAFSIPSIQQSLPQITSRVKNVAVHAIIQISHRVNVDIAIAELYTSELLTMLTDNNTAIQASAVEVLCATGDKGIIRKIFTLIGTNDDLNETLFASLKKRPRILEELLSAVCDDELTLDMHTIAFIAVAAQQPVVSHYHGSNLHRLHQLTNEGFNRIASQWHFASDPTREAIVDALFKLDSNRALEFFVGLAEEVDPWTKMQCIELIAKIENVKSAEYITRFIHDEDDNVRELATTILASRGLPSDLQERIR